MNSRLVWNGSGPTKPIDFNFGSVQSQVNRNSFYSQNLNATSSQTLTYNQNLNESITAQPTPGFAINPSTGLMTISALETPLIVDNPNSLNAGADKAFSGNIIAADGSFVEFDWMLDGVSGATNQAPVIMDAVASGAPGALFTHTFSVSDPNGNPVTFDPGFFDILGPASAIAPVFNSSNGTFTWDSTGSVAGTYIFQVRARDPGNLTDVGQITVTLAENAVPEPSTFIVMAGLMTFVGGSAVRHRRKSAQQR